MTRRLSQTHSPTRPRGLTARLSWLHRFGRDTSMLSTFFGGLTFTKCCTFRISSPMKTFRAVWRLSRSVSLTWNTAWLRFSKNSWCWVGVLSLAGHISYVWRPKTSCPTYLRVYSHVLLPLSSLSHKRADHLTDFSGALSYCTSLSILQRWEAYWKWSLRLMILSLLRTVCWVGCLICKSYIRSRNGVGRLYGLFIGSTLLLERTSDPVGNDAKLVSVILMGLRFVQCSIEMYATCLPDQCESSRGMFLKTWALSFRLAADLQEFLLIFHWCLPISPQIFEVLCISSKSRLSGCGK